jgi:hypothetical protein
MQLENKESNNTNKKVSKDFKSFNPNTKKFYDQ